MLTAVVMSRHKGHRSDLHGHNFAPHQRVDAGADSGKRGVNVAHGYRLVDGGAVPLVTSPMA